MKKSIISLIFVITVMAFTNVVKAETQIITDIEYGTKPEEVQRFEMVKKVASKARSVISEEGESNIFTDWIGLLDNKDVEKNLTGNRSDHITNFGTVYNNNPNEVDFILTANEGQIEYILPTPKNVTAIYLRARWRGTMTFKFYDENGDLVETSNIIKEVDTMENIRSIINAKNVKRITVESTAFTRIAEMEFDVIENYYAIEKVSVIPSERSATLNWEIPTHKKLNDIKVNNVSVGLVNTKAIENLRPYTQQQITITAVYTDGVEIHSIIKFFTKRDITPPNNVKDLKATVDSNGVKLTFTKPEDKDYSHVNIYRNGTLIARNIKANEYIDSNVVDEKIYTYKVVSYDDVNNGSEGVSVEVDLTREIKNIKAIAKAFNEVELKWDNPSNSNFEYVIIYRKTNEGNILRKVRSLFNGNEDYAPLFQTNGTVFKDLTATGQTSYKYKLTTYVAGDESEGVTVSVTTPKIAIINPEIVEKDDNSGDYLLKWELPTTGQVKITIDGKEFAVVNAADKQKLIPADKLVIDIFGDVRTDLIKIVPIAPDGTVGDVTTPNTSSGGGLGGIKMPDTLTPNNLVSSTMSIIALVGLFFLLGIAFLVAPRFINLIRNGINNAKGAK